MAKIAVILGTSLILLAGAGCSITTHQSDRASTGAPAKEARSLDYKAMLELAKSPGQVKLTRVVAADWKVDRAGLINLDHERARQAGLRSGDEEIAVQFFALEHPQHGLYLIDTGVAASFRSKETAPVGAMMQSAMNLDELNVKVDTKTWLASQASPLMGVFATHLHMDHIMGLHDIPTDVPIYTGPGESDGTRFLYLFTQGLTDDTLEDFGPLQELNFPAESETGSKKSTRPSEPPLLDVFGDGQVFALHVPGHTRGSLAFVVRTGTGPELVAGDACHTSWGWQNSVEPGEFNEDTPQSASSLALLKALETQLPGLKVHPGHQHIETE